MSKKISQNIKVLFERRMLVLLFLGASSGLPFALSGTTLQAWLTVEGLDLKLIGLFALVELPYAFQFVWAPLLDRFEPLGLGRRRSWIFFFQWALAAVCFLISQIDPKHSPELLGVFVLLLAFLSASQDTVADAYRTDLLDPSLQGVGVSIVVFGYRTALLFAGGVAFILADQYLGWPGLYRLMSLFFMAFSFFTLCAPSLPKHSKPIQSEASTELVGFFTMICVGSLVFLLLNKLMIYPTANIFIKLVLNSVIFLGASIAGWFSAKYVGFPSFTIPLDEMFSREGALKLLALIVFYKLGDAFAAALFTTFLIRGLNFSPSEIGFVVKFVGFFCAVSGAFLGGILINRLSLFRSLLLFGILQSITNLGFWIIAMQPKNYVLMVAALGLDSFFGGMGSAAFITLATLLTDRRFSASQYAFLSALSAVGSVYVGPVSGVLVSEIGWAKFFLFSMVAAFPGLMLLVLLKKTIANLGIEKVVLQ